MAIFAISDLHLPLGIDKPMDIFGWTDYVDRIRNNWNTLVKDDDTVLIGGDVSWATYLEESLKDFEFINNLPGRKIISKGNHDYWWTTASKLGKFKEANNLDSITFLHNNSVLVQDFAVCCTRGWKSPFDKDFNSDDERIYEREIGRLRLSLEDGKKLSDRIIVMLHYPPDVGFYELLEEYNAELCIYGHLHGSAAWEKGPKSEKIMLVSADYLNFCPFKLYD